MLPRNSQRAVFVELRESDAVLRSYNGDGGVLRRRGDHFNLRLRGSNFGVLS